MSAEKNINTDKKLDEIFNLVHQMQDVHKRNEGDIEQLKKMSHDVEENIIKLNKAVDSSKYKMPFELTKSANMDKGSEEYKKASSEFNNYLRNRNALSKESVNYIVKSYVDSYIEDDESPAKIVETKSLLTSSNPDGGYWILPDRLPMRETRVFETSPVREYASSATTSSNSIQIPVDYDEFDGGDFVGEDETRAETNNSKIDMTTIFVGTQYVKVRASDEMLQDAGFDVEGWIMKKAQSRLARRANRSYMIGTSPKGPIGILTYPNWTIPGVFEPKKIERIKSGVNGTFVGDAFVKMQNSVKEPYQGRAIWMIRRSEFYNVAILKDGIGRYLLNTDDPLKNSVNKILLGKPVVFADDVPTAATGSLSVIYGDFEEGYTIVDKPGLNVLRNPYVQDGVVIFRVGQRTGGNVVNFEALKIMELSA